MKMRLLFAGLVLAVLLVIGGSIYATGKTYYVPKDFATLQEAIDAAEDGDTIVVAEGTYEGNIYFKGKSITLKSTEPDDSGVVANTIIEGTEPGSVVTIDGNGTIKGFTITSGDIDCRGIYVKNASPTIENCTIIDNQTAELGGGIYISTITSKPKIINCIIINQVIGGTPEISQSFVDDGLVDNPSDEEQPEENTTVETPTTGPAASSVLVDDCQGMSSSNGVWYVTDSHELYCAQILANDGDTIILHPGTYIGQWVQYDVNKPHCYTWIPPIYPRGKDLTFTSTDPENPDIVAGTIISGEVSRYPCNPYPCNPNDCVDGRRCGEYPLLPCDGISCSNPCNIGVYTGPDGRIPNYQELIGLTISCDGCELGCPYANFVSVVVRGGIPEGELPPSITISKCQFIGNNSTAVWSDDANLTIDSCTISDKKNFYGGDDFPLSHPGTLISAGKSTSNPNPVSVIIENSDISNNTPCEAFGSMLIHINNIEDVTISNCTITGNTGSIGYIIHISSYLSWFNHAVNTTISDCIITGNTALNIVDLGRGITDSYDGSNITIKDCTIKDNISNATAGVYTSNISINDTGADVLIDTCDVINNTNLLGSGNFAINITGCNSANIYKSTITGNKSRNAGGGICLGSPYTQNVTIDSCLISNNEATVLYPGADGSNGGGIKNSAIGTVVTHCTIKGNYANGRGGGIYGQAKMDIINCMITDNQAGADGGGIYLSGGNNTNNIINCTIANNTAQHLFGGVYIESGNLTNCILWGNTDYGWDNGYQCDYDQLGGTQFNYGLGTMKVNISHCDIQGSKSIGACQGDTGVANYLLDVDGPSNINQWCSMPEAIPTLMGGDKGNNILPPEDQDPLFGIDYHIAPSVPSSPCINAGDNSVVNWTFDIDGEARIQGPSVDIGADETVSGSPPPPPPNHIDINSDSSRVLGQPNTTYHLTTDLLITSGTGFTITADNVTLDLGGHSITCSSGDNIAAIFARDVNNINVINGTISIPYSKDGIYFQNVSYGFISGNSIFSIPNQLSPRAITLEECDNIKIINNRIDTRNSNFTGLSAIYIGNSTENLISWNSISAKHNGLYLSNSEAVIDNNEIYGCGAHGIYMGVFCQNNEIKNNRIYSNNGKGIQLYAADNNVIKNNDINNNGGGIGLLGYISRYDWDTTNNIIRGNDIHSNSGDGIYVTSASFSNQFLYNKVIDNQGSGFKADSSQATDNILQDNIFCSNAILDIDVSGGATITCINNQCFSCNYGACCEHPAFPGNILYAGTNYPVTIYKYTGSDWDRISPDDGLGLDDEIVSLLEYHGAIYAATGAYQFNKWRGKVWKYNGGTDWQLISEGFGNGPWVDFGITAVGVYNNKLYAATTTGELFKYCDGTTWSSIPEYLEYGRYYISALQEWNGKLYFGHTTEGPERYGCSYYDGTTFKPTQGGPVGKIFDFEVYNNLLFSSTPGYIYYILILPQFPGVSPILYPYNHLPQCFSYALPCKVLLETYNGSLYYSVGRKLLKAGGTPTTVFDTQYLCEELQYYCPPDYGIITSMASSDDGILAFGTTGKETLEGYYESLPASAGNIYVMWEGNNGQAQLLPAIATDTRKDIQALLWLNRLE